MRGTVLAALLAGAVAGPAGAAGIEAARFAQPTGRYPHGVLGDAVEWGALEMTVRPCAGCAPEGRVAVLPGELVFEDTAPRLVDLDGDGAAEVLAVESHRDLGARVVLWGAEGRLAASDFIGTRFRWIGLAGAGDLDGDGRIEVAGVDRLHLARVLRVWRREGAALVPVAAAEGHTNHRIGDREILGGVRDCGAGAEVVTATPDWSRLMASRLEAGALVSRDAGPNAPGRAEALMACR